MVETHFLSYHWKPWMNWKNAIPCGLLWHALSPQSLEIHHYKVQNTGGCAHQHQGCTVCNPHQIICPYPHTNNASRITLTYWCWQQYCYFPRIIYNHLQYTHVDMFLKLLVFWFWCTLQMFLNANFSFTASQSLFEYCSPHFFVSRQLKQREWHSPHEGMVDSPIHLTPQPQFPNHHCETCYPISLISITIRI